MKIEFNPDLVTQQQYHCICCGRGCRSFLVAVRPDERQRIAKLADWPAIIGTERLFVRHPTARKLGFGLAKRPDGRCVFLDDNNLCIIHKRFGLAAKPLACQLFPFVLTPVAGKLHVGLRFDCPGVIANEAGNLRDYARQLKQLANKLVTPAIEQLPLPPLLPGQHVAPDTFLAVNDALLHIVTSDALPLTQRLHWLYRFASHLKMVKWKNVAPDDAPDLLAMFKGATLAELQNTTPSASQAPSTAGGHSAPTLHFPLPHKPRRLLGQIFFCLCQPTTIVTAPERNTLPRRIRDRLTRLRHMRQMGHTKGTLPKIQPHWPDIDLATLEPSFGPWPDDVQSLVSRHLLCRLAGMGYCGHNFYNYSLLEGLHTLILALVTLGYTMRIEAAKDNRHHLTLSDAQAAILTIDGNLGYSPALGFTSSRLRLRYLTDHLPTLINHYCS